MRLFILVIVYLIISSGSGLAKDYEVGTVGHLYEDCKDTVQMETLEATFQSRCYQFTATFLQSSFNHLYAIGHAPPDYFRDSFSEKCRDVAHIRHDALMKSMACDNLEHALVQVPVEVAYSFIAWAKWSSEKNPDILHEDLRDHIKDIILPGAYCDYNKDHVWHEGLIEINPALYEYSKDDYTYAKDKSFVNLSKEEKYKNCEAAVGLSQNYSNSFLKAQCGAFIQAELAFQHYLKNYMNFPVATGECAQEISKIGPDEALWNNGLLNCPEKISELDYANYMLALRQEGGKEDDVEFPCR